MNLFKTIIFLLLSMAILSAIFAEDPISINCKLDEKTYAIGESIKLEIVTSTKKDTELEFNELTVLQIQDNLVVKNDKGVQIECTIEPGKQSQVYLDWKTISSGKPHTYNVDFQKFFPKHPYRKIIDTLDNSGTYTITFSRNVKVRIKGSTEILWEGNLESKPINFTIKVPTESELTESAKSLIDANASEQDKLRHIKVLASSKSSKSLNAFLGALKDMSVSVKIEAVQKLSVYVKEPEVLEGIRKLLEETKNPFLRAEVMVILGEVGSKDAIQLLIKECNSKIESYRAAINILGNVGDSDCISTLEEIAKTDETPWVRERAKESIQKIQLRNKSK